MFAGDTSSLKGESPVLRYAAIVLCTLLTLSWNLSHARALPGQETGAAPPGGLPKT